MTAIQPKLSKSGKKKKRHPQRMPLPIMDSIFKFVSALQWPYLTITFLVLPLLKRMILIPF